jgi:hypothetical protein
VIEFAPRLGLRFGRAGELDVGPSSGLTSPLILASATKDPHRGRARCSFQSEGATAVRGETVSQRPAHRRFAFKWLKPLTCSAIILRLRLFDSEGDQRIREKGRDDCTQNTSVKLSLFKSIRPMALSGPRKVPRDWRSSKLAPRSSGGDKPPRARPAERLGSLFCQPCPSRSPNAWKDDYNNARRRSALSDLTPTEFAAHRAHGPPRGGALRYTGRSASRPVTPPRCNRNSAHCWINCGALTTQRFDGNRLQLWEIPYSSLTCQPVVVVS